ncbi:ribosomal LP1 [Brachionus plicatilis]|uniref:Large ribosomal subunit protein P1 n=1 Tax=Brachionus plicatilis TaxID=10195 RepID=A0A3M7P5V4_BRAPC|nr:ribosomal LP1 [Brachionus plicatilis]
MVGQNDELACVYASLILADDNIGITSDKISAILKAANYDIEPYWPGLFANALESVNVRDLVNNIGSGASAPAPGAAAAAPAAAKEEPKKEEKKKEEKKEESEDEDMGFGLFD